MRLNATNIYPLTDFRKNIFKYVDQLHDAPVVLTRAGKSAAVLLSPEKYEELINKIELLSAIDEAEEDIRNGRVMEHEKFKEEMEAHFGIETIQHGKRLLRLEE